MLKLEHVSKEVFIVMITENELIYSCHHAGINKNDVTAVKGEFGENKSFDKF